MCEDEAEDEEAERQESAPHNFQLATFFRFASRHVASLRFNYSVRKRLRRSIKRTKVFVFVFFLSLFGSIEKLKVEKTTNGVDGKPAAATKHGKGKQSTVCPATGYLFD